MTDPILITGAGPTGLTAALELSRMGVPVRLIDKRAAPATTSRAIGVQARTLELFRQRGLADEMVRLGNKGRFGSVYGGGKRVFHLDFAHVESPFPYLLFISQAETERILRDACAREGIKPEWSVELVAFRQDALSHDPSPFHAVLRHRDGRLGEVAAPWMISAEGTRSIARTTLDLPFEGHTREEQYALGDIRIDGDLADTDFHIFSSEHGFMGLFPMGGDHFRLIASNPLSTPEKDPAPSLEEIQRIYDMRSHIPARFHDCVWSSWFRINSRMVSRVKAGRIFLGGDAAHIHSPAGAQGMNTGIQDMINLCWKLALVLKGQAPPALLDTYGEDRLPAMRNVLSQTDSLTTTIGTENPVVRTLFNHLGPWVVGTGIVQASATAGMSQIALDYRDSPLSDSHHTGGSLRAGDRVPDVPVRLGQGDGWREATLHEALDPSRFTLLVHALDDGNHRVDRSAFPPDSIVSWLITASTDGARDALDGILGRGSATLVRPDGYAALTTSLATAPAHLGAWCAKWRPPSPRRR
ncbi:FAD-dependent monooxygenase [Lichenifustis flavocetrariae]|uniref:FAD-dependent monooxygenase n=1 Tax=Lichenifustis flavocetrariae TaxID=2949735 RepID=A0AA42CLW5_9HYPH|nr:FAD-dependent monooxygenase [Lichenifustis flavocetrariae]MCW6507745.1 FAD-dependent monooxygenase [Lichenifustis flavocetrariae]